MKITIDPHSGFCFGVVRSINIAEEQLKEKKQLYCLGDIVHNNKEVDRLAGAGMIVVHALNKDELEGKPVLIRAHGEPPETYRTASDFHIPLIDATCPVVLKLQERIRDGYKKIKEMNGQLVIFGKKGHAEVIGLEGQTDYNAKVVSGIDDLDILDYSRPILLYSQTTQNPEMFKRIRDEIEKRLLESNDGVKPVLFEAHDTICRQVANREPKLRQFARDNDICIFVSGKKSSNGLFLFSVCKNENERSYLISEVGELKEEWFTGANTVGITGATSTPMWLMKEVEDKIQTYS